MCVCVDQWEGVTAAGVSVYVYEPVGGVTAAGVSVCVCVWASGRGPLRLGSVCMCMR